MSRGQGANRRTAAGRRTFLASAFRVWLLALTLAISGLCCSCRRLSDTSGTYQGAGTLSKKGVGGWYAPGIDLALEELGVTWFYTWKASAGAAGITPPPGVEHVPMIWGAKETTPENLAAATTEPGTGIALLGFNEPDNADQAVMSVEQALALWPSLAAMGRRLGSPAVEKNAAVHGGWLDQFISGADAAGYPPNFIAVHYYGEDTARWDVKTAVADMQAAFAEAAAAMMNALPWVELYAFFALWPYLLEAALAGVDLSGADGVDTLSSHLFEKDGSMTAVGKAYQSA